MNPTQHPTTQAVRKHPIVQRLITAGLTPYLVGGGVRDAARSQLSGKPIQGTPDNDLVIQGDLNAEAFESAVLAALPGVTVNLTGRSFGVLKIRTPDGEDFDLAIPRIDGKKTGARGNQVAVHGDPRLDIKDDLARRDFTFNAAAVNLKTGDVIDPFGGLDDIRKDIIRFVGNPDERIAEDPTRMLRAMRFYARGFGTLSPDTFSAIQANARKLAAEHPSRIWREMLSAEKPGKGILDAGPDGTVQALRAMAASGLLEVIIPEWAACAGFDQRNPHHHQTVDAHLLAVMEHVAAQGGSPAAIWAALLHDVAKPATFALSQRGTGTFYGHEDVGADIAQRVCHTLGTGHAFAEEVSTAVALHMQVGNAVTRKAARKLVHTAGSALGTLLALHVADRADHRGEDLDAVRAHVAFIQSAQEDLDTLSDSRSLDLRGQEIAAMVSNKRDIGRVKEALFALVVDGTLPNERQALRDYAALHLV